MLETLSFFATCELGGQIIIVGGHDDSKNALWSAWVYHVRRDEWVELASMSQERDKCEGVVIGSEFWVVSGYKTESQGGIKGSVESFDLGIGQWRRLEDAWVATQCPKSYIGVGKDGKLFCWAESDSKVRAKCEGLTG